MENGHEIARTITDMGFDCECVKGVVSPRFEIYYFKLKNPYHINMFGAKQIKVLEQVFSTRFMFDNNMVEYSFSIAFEHKDFVLPFKFSGDTTKHEKVYLGKDTQNNDVVIDFYNNVNHLLIGGTTGAGKSSLIHSIILGLILCGLRIEQNGNMKPYIYLFDPKKVEFAKYQSCPMCCVETETNGIIGKLQFLVDIMEARYERYQKQGFSDYKEAKEHAIFVVIDELADLMMTSNEQIENNIIRLAQKGRGAGIHLIVATQNPIAKVLTSLIKANMTTRIALKCATKTQSIVMLDHIGAEKLLGKGDALLKLPNKVDEIRLQSCYCDNERIKTIIQKANNLYFGGGN